MDLPQPDFAEYKVGDRDTRPWGTYEVIAVGRTAQGDEFCEKKITVLPGQILSLQSHKLRREFWRVLEGELTIILDNRRMTLDAGKDIKVPLGSIHAMANLSSSPCIVFERQEGLCREDDIRRYLDAYGRITAEPSDPVATASMSVYKKILDDLKILKDH
jgi:mannose-1-phosphate guanylyltransferase/mannose-1-phosphate guanylyltransferase/mannose-6-phosphate isomerase